MILKIDRTPNWPTISEIGIRGFFRLTVESSLTDRILRFGLTVKSPLSGTIRRFGFDRDNLTD